MSNAITITIDGVEIQGPSGETIINVADDAGIYIPRLCHHPDLVPHGSCRLCTVMVNGRPQAACTTPVAPGMIVENQSARLLELRRKLVEMLLVEGNHFCMFCEKSGNCELQALAYRFEITVPRYPYLLPDRKVDASHPDIFIDHNRCILCARCIRAVRDIDGKHELGFVGRGRHKRVAVNSRDGLGNTDIKVTDKAVQSCPVGALLEKHVGYALPIGNRRYDEKPIGSDIEARQKVQSK